MILAMLSPKSILVDLLSNDRFVVWYCVAVIVWTTGRLFSVRFDVDCDRMSRVVFSRDLVIVMSFFAEVWMGELEIGSGIVVDNGVGIPMMFLKRPQ